MKNKYILCWSIFVCMILCCLSSAYAADPVFVEQIVVDQETVIVPVGKTVSIKATVEPKNATSKNLDWVSQDEAIATVSNGKIKGIACGETTVVITAKDEKAASINIRVVVIQGVKKINLPENKVSLAPGARHQLSGSVEPEDASIQTLSWSSSNEKIAVVDDTGLVTAVGKGSASITAVATDGSGVKASVSVKVENYDLVFLSRKPQKVEYQYSGTGNLKVRGSVKNGNVSIPDIDVEMWTSVMGSPAVKEVEVTPVKPGTDVITITANGKKLKYTAYVADDFAEHVTQYVPLTDTSPKPSNGSFRNIVYGTPYSAIKNDLIQLYGDDYKVMDNECTLNITFNNPGITVAGHEVMSLSFEFCYDLDQEGFITKDEELASFYRAEYVFGYSRENDAVFEDLHLKLNELYGKSDEDKYTNEHISKKLGATDHHWKDNHVYISLRVSGPSVSYLWGNGFSKKTELGEIYAYLLEAEKQGAGREQFGSSSDGL